MMSNDARNLNAGNIPGQVPADAIGTAPTSGTGNAGNLPGTQPQPNLEAENEQLRARLAELETTGNQESAGPGTDQTQVPPRESEGGFSYRHF